MSQEMICTQCTKSGTETISRCGHILHDHCYEQLDYRKKCPKCGTELSKYLVIEKFIVKIKSSILDYDTKEELIFCADSFATYKCYDNLPAIYYDSSLLEQFQRLGWDINNQVFGGVELFYRACLTDNIDKVNLLIEHALDLENYGENGLTYAINYSSYNVFDRLTQVGVKFDQKIILSLTSEKNFGMLNQIIKSGADVNSIEKNGKRSIHAAAENGSIEIIQFLTKNGADFLAVDDDGNSILHYSCLYKGLDLVQYLIESGFDYNIQNKKHITPLMLSIKHNNQSVIDFLIQKKAGLDFLYREGNTPLHWCATNGKYDLMKVLITDGANVNAKNNYEKTPLHVVAHDTNTNNIVRFLLDNGAEMNVLDRNGKSPLYYFHSRIDNELKNRFFGGDADLTIKNENSKSILHLMLKL